MFRPACLLLPAVSLACLLTLSGCRTIYSETYSPRRNRFKKEAPRPEAPVILPQIPETTGPNPTPGVPGDSATPSTGMPDATALPSQSAPSDMAIPGMGM